MNVAIPGGLGFIGHHFCAELPPQIQLQIIDSEYATQLDLEEGSRLIFERKEYIRFRRANWLTTIKTSNLHSTMISPAETVVFFAGPSHSRLLNKNIRYFSQTMTCELTECIQNFISAGTLKRFVYVSSSMVYGDFDQADENHPCQPTDIYGTLKLAGERILKEYADRYGFEYVIVRPIAVYGPRDQMGRVIEKWTNAALTNQPLFVNGENYADFTFVDDLVQGLMAATLNPRAANQTFNISFGKKVSLEECAREILNLTGSSSELLIGKRDKMPKRGNLVCDKAKLTLGYNPQYNLKLGLQKYLNYIVNHKKSVATPIHMLA